MDELEFVNAETILREEKDKELILMEESPRKRATSSFLGLVSNNRELIRRFCAVVPVYYDRAGIFWMWDDLYKKWVMTDDIEILGWLEKSSSNNVIKPSDKSEIITALKIEGRRTNPLPMPKHWLQFNKEIVDIKTGDLFPATSKYFCVNPIPHNLGDERDISKFEKLFKDWVAPDEVINLFEYLAFCLMPDYFIERIICLQGSGSNGKSCYLKIMVHLLGMDNVTSTSLESLVKNRFELSRLYKKLVAIMGETNLQSIDNTQIIKRLSSGKDLVPIEFKGKKLIDDVNYAKLIIATNNIPPSDDKTDGFYRRWRITEFPNQFQEEKDILADLTERDYENLCRYLVFVLDNLYHNQRGFTGEGTIAQRKEKFEEKSNPLDKFFKLFIDEEANGDIPKWEFEKKLNDWLRENKLRILSDVTINKLMKQKGYNSSVIRKEWYENNEAKSKPVKVWVGVRWK